MKTPQNFMTPEEKLRSHSAEFRKEIIKILDNIYFAIGYCGSNAILIEGDNGSILVDTLEGTEGAEVLKAEFKELSSKPITTIIYTHSHQDHVGGASVFAEGNNPEIICRHPFSGLLGPPAISTILRKRAGRQFGYNLSSEERLNIGLGTGERLRGGLGAGFLPPTKQFSDEKLSLNIEGIQIELTAAPGETDDQLFLWLPEQKVLISADNYYKSFPNLYAIRGTPYRDISAWVKSLDKMISKGAEYLLPGHSRPITGREKIKEVLTDYRDAIDFVLQESLKYINQGYTPDELVELVQLPSRLAEKPYLQEYYGTVPWTVRSIYTGYLGWFDGNPCNLFPLSPREEAEQMAELAGGVEKLYRKALQAAAAEKYQWTLQLTDYLLAMGKFVPESQKLKIKSYRSLARQQISAAGRNYYFTCAQELEEELTK
ncbi:MAG: alkyl sulfatase dimerization domain-containing protein [Peptococcaceae bacterium]